MINTILIGNYIKITSKLNGFPYCTKHGAEKPHAIYCRFCGLKLLGGDSIEKHIDKFSYLFKEFKVKMKGETDFYVEWDKSPAIEISQEGTQFQFDLEKVHSEKQKLIKYVSERPVIDNFKLSEIVTIITFNKNEIIFV